MIIEKEVGKRNKNSEMEAKKLNANKKDIEKIESYKAEEKGENKKTIGKFVKTKKHIISNEFKFFFISVLFLEAIIRILLTKNFNDGIIYTVLFSVPMALFFAILTNIFKNKLRKIVFYILAFFLPLITAIQIIYVKVFGTLLVFSSFFFRWNEARVGV